LRVELVPLLVASQLETLQSNVQVTRLPVRDLEIAGIMSFQAN